MSNFDITSDNTKHEDSGSNPYWIYSVIGLLLLNALAGLITFEWAWYKARRFRDPIPELDQNFPAYCRVDSHKWRKWAFYPGAMTVLYPRFLLGFPWGILAALTLKIFLCGADTQRPLKKGCRKSCLRFWIKFYVIIFNYGTNFMHSRFVYVKPEEVGYYEEYLGTRAEQEAEQISNESD